MRTLTERKARRGKTEMEGQSRQLKHGDVMRLTMEGMVKGGEN